MALRVFRLEVAYDGTAFHGWQVQPGQRTVQGVVEDALHSELRETVRIHGAGRTDAGVHARAQVASFAHATDRPAASLAPALNARLPEDVRVTAAADAAAGFDARRSATGRRYVYRLLDRDDVLWRRFAWHPRRAPARDALAAAVAPLAGRHDFSAFRAAGSSEVRPECALSTVAWREWEGGIALELVGDHFLYHMVRTIVGTALAHAARPDPADAMARTLAGRDRSRAGPTAPPHGLCLEQVYYAGEENR